MTKRVWHLVCLFLIAALVLQGCAAVTAPKENRPPLRVEWTIWEGDYTILIAKEKGFFEKNGVDVELIFYEAFSGAVTDITVNRIDVGFFALGDLFNAARLGDVAAVAVYDSGGTSTVVSRSEIQSVTDLRGKRIGVSMNTYNEMFVRHMLTETGVSIKDVTLVDVPAEEVPTRLADDLDAGYVWAPYDRAAVEYGHKVLYSSSSFGSLSPDVIVFRRDVLEDRPDDVRAFLNAWFEAVEYRLAHPEESNEIIAKATGQSVAGVALSGDVQIYRLQDNIALFDKNQQNTIYNAADLSVQFLIERGQVTIAPKIEDILDPSFLQ
jgi:NitT/TauT family transport system substrate-binding protein